MNRAKGEVEAAADPSGYSFLMTFFFGAGRFTPSRPRSRRRVPAARARRDNETFPAISATKLTASQAGSPSGGLVRMSGNNCTTCQDGTKEKGEGGVYLSTLCLSGHFLGV